MTFNQTKLDELIDNHPVSGLQWRVVILCFIVAVLDGYDMQAIAFTAPSISLAYDLGPADIGTIISAGLVGLMLGSLLFSPVADKVGRKPVIIGACACMSVFSLLTATADSYSEFLSWRFLTGLGLGAAMPSLNALTSEYAPARRRALLMTLMFVGVPIGNIIGGIVAALSIERFGWESVFIAGGVGPLVMIPVLIVLLPESLQFLNRQPNKTKTIKAVLTRMGRLVPEAAMTGSAPMPVAKSASDATALFRDGRALITLLIWSVFFTNLLLTFSIITWLPSLLSLIGYPLDRALYIAAGAGAGGAIGGLVIAWLVDRFGFPRILTSAAVMAAVSLAITGYVTQSMVLTIVMIIIVSTLIGGLQFGLNAVAVQFYPLTIRSTGLGWALAIGRLGAIAGPLITGLLLASQWEVGSVFVLLGFFGLASATLLLFLARQMINLSVSTRPSPA